MVLLCRIIVCSIITRRCLTNFSLKNYIDNTHEHNMRGNTRWKSALIAYCPSRCFMLHCIVAFNLYILDEYAHIQNLAHLAKHCEIAIISQFAH